MEALLFLRCEGFEKDDFKFCSGVENMILDLQKIEHTEKYIELIQYIDKIPKLFEKPCVNQNIVSNLLFKLYELEYADDKAHKNFALFLENHRRCGIIADIRIKNEYK